MTYRDYPANEPDDDDRLPPEPDDAEDDPAAVDLDDELYDDDDEEDDPAEARARRPVMYRATSSDPVFGYLIALALAIGLTPLIPGNSDLRYVIVWAVLAGFGVLAWLLGNMTRIGQETPDNLGWGIIFGMVIGVPLWLFGGQTLTTTAQLLFSGFYGGQVAPVTPGAALALLLFAQPTGETLFFRGVLQETRPFWLVGLLASLWSGLLFLPMLDIGAYPFVTLLIGTALVMMNLMYSYVRQRNGLAAAWLCQIVTNLVVLFLPFVSG